MGYAFISYSSKNKSSAIAIKQLLEQHHIKTWIDFANIPPGANYAEAIIDAIENCSCLILLLTNYAQKSTHIDTELERAKNYKKTIYTIQLEDLVLIKSFEYYLSTEQMIRVNSISENEPDIQRVISEIKRTSPDAIDENATETPVSGKNLTISHKRFMICMIVVCFMCFLCGTIAVTSANKQEHKRKLESYYHHAVQLLESKEFDEACDAFLYAGDMGHEKAYERVGEPLYQKAEELLELGNKTGACYYFYLAGDYSDSFLRFYELQKQLQIHMADGYAVCINNDGSISIGGKEIPGNFDVSDWNHITAIMPEAHHLVGLKDDGTVLATGSNEYGQCNVDEWTDVVDIKTGHDYTVGLKKDGTVVAAGNNEYGQCNVDEWTDVADIKTGHDYTVGLKKDGTVVAAGNNEYGQCNVSEWKNIKELFLSYQYIVGLKNDGSLVAAGENKYGELNLAEWTDIVSFSSGDCHTIGLRKDGTVVAAGDNSKNQCNVSSWKNIQQIDAFSSLSVGIRSDGTYVTTGSAPEAWLIN